MFQNIFGEMVGGGGSKKWYLMEKIAQNKPFIL